MFDPLFVGGITHALKPHQKFIKHSLKSGTWMGQGWSPDDPLKEHGEVSSKNALVYLLRIGFLPNRAFTSNTVTCLDKPTLLAVLEAAEKTLRRNNHPPQLLKCYQVR